MMPNVNVTVSAQTTTTKVQPNIRFDPTYIKTLPGIIKIVEVIVGLVGFICVQTVPYSGYGSAGGWYAFVAMTGFWVTLILIVAYLFHIVERLHWLPWLLGETVYTVAWSVFFFIAACVSAANGRHDPGWGAASFFGFVAMIVYGYEAYTKYFSWRAGDIAQGERTTTANADTSTPTGPSYPAY